MKKLFMISVISSIIASAANAAFVCDYNYTSEGQDVQSTLQIEKIKGTNLLTMRARSGELITALQVSSIQKTSIGSIVHFFMNIDGVKIEGGKLVLPKILPGPGQIFWGDEGTEAVDCRKQ